MTDPANISLLGYFETAPERRAEILAFININKNADVKDLALKALPDTSWPKHAIINQIKSRQKAGEKMPDWADHPEIILPTPNILEQASSSATSLYKAALVNGETFADLTAGSGADTAAFAKHFKAGYAVDFVAENTELLRHNLPYMTDTNIEVVTSTAEDFIADMPPVDFVYIDPQRRTDEGKRGLILLDSCSPAVPAMLADLFARTEVIMIKTSPALDITRCIHDLDQVFEVHIIEWRGQCREVLYLLKKNSNVARKNIPIHAVTIDDKGQAIHKISFTIAEESNAEAEMVYHAPNEYLYEASPALMKSGGFHMFAKIYDLKKLHKHTHLYSSSQKIDDFPGRRFLIEHIISADKKALKAVLPDKKANLSIRNFPMQIDQLRKKLGIKDGGKTYIFACITAPNDDHRLIICSKA